MSVSKTKEEENLNAVWTYQGYTLDTSNFTTAMVHLYRAEVTRTNLWRSRLDTTTNWAVVTTGAALTFAFSSPQNPHFVLILVLFLMLTFLNMEARRYTYYALWYHRVRLLETEFFATMISPPFHPSEDWNNALHQTLRTPIFPISRWRALANRYRRNYIWLVSIMLFSWGLKLLIHPTLAHTTQDVIQRAAIGDLIPGSWVIGILGLIYVGLGALTLIITRQSAWRDGYPQTTTQPAGEKAPTKSSRVRLTVVITTHKENVANRLMHELARGVTALEGIGMYTGEERDVLLCATNDQQITKLREIVAEADPDAFVIVTQATEVHGRNFRPFEPPS